MNVLSETFCLLGDPSRPRVLLHCVDGPKSVTDGSGTLDLPQSLVSYHLRLLRGACLMPRVRHPRWMFYGITDRHVGDVLLTMLAHAGEKIERDRELQAVGETLWRRAIA